MGTGLIGANLLVGATPNMSGTTVETGLREDYHKGMSYTGKVLPVMGKVRGTNLVMNSISKLKAFKFKGAKTL